MNTITTMYYKYDSVKLLVFINASHLMGTQWQCFLAVGNFWACWLLGSYIIMSCSQSSSSHDIISKQMYSKGGVLVAAVYSQVFLFLIMISLFQNNYYIIVLLLCHQYHYFAVLIWFASEVPYWTYLIILVLHMVTAGVQCTTLYFFPGLFFISFWGLGLGVLGLGSYIGFLGVRVFSWWGLGPVVWGLLVFLGWGSLHKHKRITLGEKMIRAPLPILCHSGLFGSVTIFGYLISIFVLTISSHTFIHLLNRIAPNPNSLPKIATYYFGEA